MLFNGAGEDGLPSVAQAWSVDHTDANTRQANRATLERIGRVLHDYKQLRFTVHGETGLAHSAPLRLAAHLGLDAVKDVDAIMETLARRRAQSCLEALVTEERPSNKGGGNNSGGGASADLPDVAEEPLSPV